MPASPQRSPRGSSGPYPISQDPFPAHLQSALDSRLPSPHSTPPFPPPSLPAAASNQAISTASSQQAPDFTAPRGLAQAGRVHKRESEAGGLDEQPRKKPRANKWDQQEPDLPASDASPALQVMLTDISWSLCWMASGHLTFHGHGSAGQWSKCKLSQHDGGPVHMHWALLVCITNCPYASSLSCRHSVLYG